MARPGSARPSALGMMALGCRARDRARLLVQAWQRRQRSGHAAVLVMLGLAQPYWALSALRAGR
jgi:hypothetical protein